MKRKIVGVALAATLSMSASASVFAADLTDVSGHWAMDAIDKMVSSGAVHGYPDGTFKPDNQITRAEFISILNSTFGITAMNATANFTDVSSSDWFSNQVAIGQAAGLMHGYPDGTFKPNNPITREEAAAVVANLLKLDTSKTNATFTDASDIQSWALGSVAAIENSNVMHGYPDGTFKPENLITRAEAVVTMENALSINGGQQTPTKTPTQTQTAATGISSVSAVNGVLTVTLNGTLSATPAVSDFVVTQSVDGAAATTVTPTSVSLDSSNTVVTLDVPTVSTGSTITYTVAYKNGTPATASCSVVTFSGGGGGGGGVYTPSNTVLPIGSGSTINAAGTYGSSDSQHVAIVPGNVTVNTSAGVTLENTVINGDLTLGAGVGEGDVILNNVTINGTLNVQGGGTHSIHVNGSTIHQLVVNKVGGTVRLVFTGNSTVQQSTTIDSGAIFDTTQLTGSGLGAITLTGIPAGTTVQLIGNFPAVTVDSPGITVQASNGTIGSLTTTSNATGSTLSLDTTTTVSTMTANGAVSVTGQGNVQTATVNVNGVSFQTSPTTVNHPPGVTVTIGTQAPQINSISFGSTTATQNGTTFTANLKGNTGFGSMNINVNEASTLALSVNNLPSISGISLVSGSNTLTKVNLSGINVSQFNPNTINYNQLFTILADKIDRTTLTSAVNLSSIVSTLKAADPNTKATLFSQMNLPGVYTTLKADPNITSVELMGALNLNQILTSVTDPNLELQLAVALAPALTEAQQLGYTGGITDKTAFLSFVEGLSPANQGLIYNQINFTSLFNILASADSTTKANIINAIDFNQLFTLLKTAAPTTQTTIFADIVPAVFNNLQSFTADQRTALINAVNLQALINAVDQADVGLAVIQALTGQSTLVVNATLSDGTNKSNYTINLQYQ